jgi:hypothetical protein
MDVRVGQREPRRLDDVLVDPDRVEHAPAVARGDQHPRRRVGAGRGLEDADLEVDEVDVAQLRPRAVHGVAERLVERVDGPVALARTEPPLTRDLDGDGRLRARTLLVGAAADRHAEVERAERLLLGVSRPGAATQQQPERRVRRLVGPPERLTLLDLLQHRARLVVGDREPSSAAFIRTFARPASSLTTSRCRFPTTSGSMCWYMSGAFASADACRPALWLNAVWPT